MDWEKVAVSRLRPEEIRTGILRREEFILNAQAE
jgi:hypothetical protein